MANMLLHVGQEGLWRRLLLLVDRVDEGRTGQLRLILPRNLLIVHQIVSRNLYIRLNRCQKFVAFEFRICWL